MNRQWAYHCLCFVRRLRRFVALCIPLWFMTGNFAGNQLLLATIFDWPNAMPRQIHTLVESQHTNCGWLYILEMLCKFLKSQMLAYECTSKQKNDNAQAQMKSRLCWHSKVSGNVTGSRTNWNAGSLAQPTSREKMVARAAPPTRESMKMYQIISKSIKTYQKWENIKNNR